MWESRVSRLQFSRVKFIVLMFWGPLVLGFGVCCSNFRVGNPAALDRQKDRKTGLL